MGEKKGKKTTRYKNDYNAKAYDSLRIVVPKGQKATIQAAADSVDESINQYTNKAVLARLGLPEWPKKEA